MTEPTLKPCPFCGNEKVTVNTKAKGYFVKQNARRAGKDTSNYTCRCTKCGAKGPLKHSEAEAAAAWNGRGSDSLTNKDFTVSLAVKINEAGKYEMLSGHITRHGSPRPQKGAAI